VQKLFFFFICMIIYGSLFPFTFSYNDGAPDQWHILLGSYNPFTSLGDILGNIVLFIPFGYLAVESLGSSRLNKPRYIKILIFGLLLALILQVIQVYLPSRSPAIADVYWNGAGIILGFILVNFIREHFPKLSITEGANIPVILSLIWLLYLFFPFIPTLDFQEIKNGLKPLILDRDFHGDDFLIGLTGWLLFAHFSTGLFREDWLSRLRLPLFALLSLPLRLIILQNAIDLSDVLAVIFAIMIWFLCLRNNPNREKILAYSLALVIAVYGLGTMDFSPYGWHFSWIPFSGFLEGSLFSNTRSLFFKLFLFGGMTWLAKSVWPRRRLVSFWIFCYILMVEVIQIFMTSRSAEITDPLLILLLASIIHVKKNTKKTEGKVIEKKTIEPVNRAAPAERKQWLFLLAAIMLFTALMSVVIKLPGMPYNVRELFLLEGRFIAIIPFALFVTWFGLSIPLITAQMLNKPNRHFIRFPLLVMAAGLVSYLLLKLSVTQEALFDITGSSNIYWFVTNQNIWGSFGRLLAQAVPYPDIWHFLENTVRFLALFSPMTFLLCLFYYAGALIKKYDIHGLSNQGKLISFSLLINLLYALPWLYFCKVIAFDHSSTDNLNELIAREGFFGLGGGGYLYLLVILLSFNSVWVSQSLYHWVSKALIIIIAGTLGWFLFNLGLEAEVQKYGLTFSGADFLLGPDRQNKLAQSMLFIRWIILYTSSVTILAWSMTFNLFTFTDIFTGSPKKTTDNNIG